MQKESSDPGRQVKVAVVGLGFMGVTHLRAHLAIPNARVVAVCGVDRLPVDGIIKGVAGNIGESTDIHLGTGVKVYTQFEDLLSDPDVEAVDLCTPTPSHPAQAISALKAGKHVLCEKPLARTSAEAREVVEAAGKGTAILMPAMCMRFWPGWNWLKSVVTDQTFGRVLAARFARFSARPAWSTGPGKNASHAGGALFDLHIHDADFVQFLFGKPDAVCATGVLGSNGEVDHVLAQYFYPGGPVVHAEGSWLLASGFSMRYTLHCERATIDYDLERGDGALTITEPGKTPRVQDVGPGDGYHAEIRYFIDCVAQKRAPRTVTARDGVDALALCEAEEQSVRSGAVIRLK
jgi:predicted dehydrogenase